MWKTIDQRLLTALEKLAMSSCIIVMLDSEVERSDVWMVPSSSAGAEGGGGLEATSPLGEVSSSSHLGFAGL